MSRGWKLHIRATRGIFVNVDENDDVAVRALAETMADILERTILPLLLFSQHEIDERDHLVTVFREVFAVDDFNAAMSDLYDWADAVRVWIEPPC